MSKPSSEKSLVLVLGAGASCEACLPVGEDLKKRIAETLDIRYDRGVRQSSGDRLISEAFKGFASDESTQTIDIKPYLDVAWRIRDAMPLAISIDNFIDSHKSDPKIVQCGKLAIASCILTAESTSLLWTDRNPNEKFDFSRLESTWYNAFFRLLTENCQQADLAERFTKVGIISFNYDRCIEHYLHSALQCYFGMKSKEAADALSKLDIHHSYGAIGKLPWQDDQNGFEFGGQPGTTKLVALASELRTFTEGIDPGTSHISAIRATISNAARIAFLGFAFHPLNVELLFPGAGVVPGMAHQDSLIYGTAYEISDPDVQVIKDDLNRLTGRPTNNQIYLRNLKCAKLFSEFRRSLSLQ